MGLKLGPDDCCVILPLDEVVEGLVDQGGDDGVHNLCSACPESNGLRRWWRHDWCSSGGTRSSGGLRCLLNALDKVEQPFADQN